MADARESRRAGSSWKEADDGEARVLRCRFAAAMQSSCNGDRFAGRDKHAIDCIGRARPRDRDSPPMISRTSIIRPYPTGACAPSTDVLDAAADFRFAGQVYPADRLDREPPIDLMKGLRYVDWPVRIQGQRQTCVAFAVAACIELLLARYRKEFIPLSPQFLYWHMRQRG